MPLLLDTHALIWWFFDNPKLSRAAYARIAANEEPVHVSAASAWEIATKVRIGKMPQGRALAENFSAYLQLQSFEPIPISVAHARLAGAFSSPHKDPFDRIIAAQAQCENLTVVTTDAAFQSLGVAIFW
ncbi:MAG: type II toxin-antitoxin system VapC family toxin [Rhodomicrobium sp.]